MYHQLTTNSIPQKEIQHSHHSFCCFHFGVSRSFAFYCDLLDSLSFRIRCRPNIKENPLINIVSLNCQVCTTYAHHIDFSDQHMQWQKIQLICLTLEKINMLKRNYIQNTRVEGCRVQVGKLKVQCQAFQATSPFIQERKKATSPF